jgi:hypothetical protein
MASNSAYRAQGDNLGSVPPKVTAPQVGARMKQPRQGSCVRIDSGDVGTFVSVAVNTGQRQIVKVVATAMLSRNDVIDLEWGRMQRGGQETILASPRRPFSDAPN